MRAFAVADVALFDDRPASELTHIVMPSMGYACGGSMLTDGGRFVIGLDANLWATVTCAGCTAAGPVALAQECQRQQRDQAAVA